MRFAPRIRAAARYLSWADPVWRWQISRSPCPNCGPSVFISLQPSAFMTRCMRCGANGTNLSLIPVIQQHQQVHPIERAYELSSYGATLAWLKRNIPHVTTSEYFPTKTLGSVVDGLLNQDVQALTFEDGSFDLVTSNQVFEHVPDDILGYAECYRVLKPGGALIFSVPLHGFAVTTRLAEVIDGKVVIYEAEYHDSRLGGPQSALTYWRHSIHDLADRVASVGFLASLVEVKIAPSQRNSTHVVYAIKDKANTLGT